MLLTGKKEKKQVANQELNFQLEFLKYIQLKLSNCPRHIDQTKTFQKRNEMLLK